MECPAHDDQFLIAFFEHTDNIIINDFRNLQFCLPPA